MESARYPPRKLNFEALIAVLVEEHALMRDGLLKAREAAAQNDYEVVRKELVRLDPVFRQHIADEESTVLGILIRQLGVKGATAEIKVFQQHRPIYQLMKKVTELASMSAAELEANQTELNDLFVKHTAAEEEQVFPRAKTLVTFAGSHEIF
jgi:hemerythrin-like domain-containing protein